MPKTIIHRFTLLVPVFWALVLLAGTVGQGLADHVITKGKLGNLDF